jgi:hypothetical protein
MRTNTSGRSRLCQGGAPVHLRFCETFFQHRCRLAELLLCLRRGWLQRGWLRGSPRHVRDMVGTLVDLCPCGSGCAADGQVLWEIALSQSCYLRLRGVPGHRRPHRHRATSGSTQRRVNLHIPATLWGSMGTGHLRDWRLREQRFVVNRHTRSTSNLGASGPNHFASLKRNSIFPS